MIGTMVTVKAERRLGWFTRPEYPTLGVFPPDADILTALRGGVCPICERGPFTVVLQHVAQKHGISGRVMRDLVGVPLSVVLCDPALSAQLSANARDAKAERRCDGTDNKASTRRVTRAERQRREKSAVSLVKSQKARSRFRICSAPDCCNIIERRGGRRTCSADCLRRLRVSVALANSPWYQSGTTEPTGAAG